MTDLSRKASHQYWSSYPDPMIYKVLTMMESVEKWTLDGNEEYEKIVAKLVEAIDNIGNIKLSKEEDFIKVALHLKATRMLYILQTIDLANPGTACRILTYSDNHKVDKAESCGVFTRRNIEFERLRLLGRIFSKENLDLIVRALENGIYA